MSNKIQEFLDAKELETKIRDSKMLKRMGFYDQVEEKSLPDDWVHVTLPLAKAASYELYMKPNNAFAYVKELKENDEFYAFEVLNLECAEEDALEQLRDIERSKKFNVFHIFAYVGLFFVLWYGYALVSSAFELLREPGISVSLKDLADVSILHAFVLLLAFVLMVLGFSSHKK